MNPIFAFISLVIANLGWTFHLSTRVGKKVNRNDLDKKVDREVCHGHVEDLKKTMKEIQTEQMKQAKTDAILLERVAWIKEWKEKNCRRDNES